MRRRCGKWTQIYETRHCRVSSYTYVELCLAGYRTKLDGEYGVRSNDRNTDWDWMLTPAVHNVPGDGDGES